MIRHALLLLLPFLALSACGGVVDPGSGNARGAPGDAGADGPLAKTSFMLPADGTPNDNGAIGPFCCTGTTATVKDRLGRPVGYVYFFDWKGDAYNTSSTSSAAPDVSIEVSAASNIDDPSSTQVTGEVDFPGAEMKPGAARSTMVGALLYTVTIETVTTLQIANATYFDMSSLTVRVDVSVI
jgi:hypothetical protein